MTGWWFGTFFVFPYIGNNHPNWLSYFSEGWPNHQPDEIPSFSCDLFPLSSWDNLDIFQDGEIVVKQGCGELCLSGPMVTPGGDSCQKWGGFPKSAVVVPLSHPFNQMLVDGHGDMACFWMEMRWWISLFLFEIDDVDDVVFHELSSNWMEICHVFFSSLDWWSWDLPSDLIYNVFVSCVCFWFDGDLIGFDCFFSMELQMGSKQQLAIVGLSENRYTPKMATWWGKEYSIVVSIYSNLF